MLFELAHAQVFEDALLDLLQTVVVFVQHPPRLAQVEMVGGGDGPGQFHQPLEVAAHHTGLSRLRMQALKPRQLLAAFLFDCARQVGLVNALPESQQVGSRGIHLAQLFLNRLELLAQKEFVLDLANFLLHFRLDFALYGHHFQFFVQQFSDPTQPTDRIRELQQRLGLLDS